MNKLISVLALMVVVLPISVTLLLNGPDNLLGVCKSFFAKLFEHAVGAGSS